MFTPVFYLSLIFHSNKPLYDFEEYLYVLHMIDLNSELWYNHNKNSRRGVTHETKNYRRITCRIFS